MREYGTFSVYPVLVLKGMLILLEGNAENDRSITGEFLDPNDRKSSAVSGGGTDFGCYFGQWLDRCDNVLDIISWREIYNRMEQCADACEHIGDNVDMVVMKNS